MTKHLKSIVARIAKCFLILITSITFTTVANTAEFSIGHGLQYSGLAGIQIASKHDNHNFRASGGIVGVGIGYDYFVTDQFSIGGSAFAGVADGKALNFNFYPSGYDKGNWILGLDIGRLKKDLNLWPDNCYIECENENEKDISIIWFSVGYKF